MEDFDDDGDIDLLASSRGLRDQLRYFRNNGDGTFDDATIEAGLEGIVSGLNLVHADYDNDGFADVFVLRGGWLDRPYPNSLLRGNGDGSFTDVTEEAGLSAGGPTQTAAWGDYDNDASTCTCRASENRATCSETRAPPLTVGGRFVTSPLPLVLNSQTRAFQRGFSTTTTTVGLTCL